MMRGTKLVVHRRATAPCNASVSQVPDTKQVSASGPQRSSWCAAKAVGSGRKAAAAEAGFGRRASEAHGSWCCEAAKRAQMPSQRDAGTALTAAA
eukprot:scaffold228_cov312-Pinguiococcus_pyrenoidosus.AAC.64